MTPENTQEKLLQLRDSLASRLAAVERDLQQAHSQDWSEQAQERENDEVLQEIAEQTRTEMRRVGAALERVKQGDYGLCANCGGTITPQRLEALPAATLCITCADSTG